MNQAYHIGPDTGMSRQANEASRMPEVSTGVSRIRSEGELTRKLIEDLAQRLSCVMRPSLPTAQSEGLRIAPSPPPQSELGSALAEIGSMVSGGNEVLRDLLHRLEL